MWICLSDSFLSIIAAPFPHEVKLVVRCRRKNDIEAVFGMGYDVHTLPGRDYQYRALIDREIVAQTIGTRLMDLAYRNFKNSAAADPAYSSVLHDVWSRFASLQEIPPYGTEPRDDFDAHPVRARRV